MKQLTNILCLIEPNLDNTHLLKEAAKLAKTQQATLHVATLVNDAAARGEQTHNLVVDTLAKENLEPSEIKQFDLLIESDNLSTVLEKIDALHCDLVIKIRQPDHESKHSLSKLEKHLLRDNARPLWLFSSSSSVEIKRTIAAVDLDENYQSSDLKMRQELNRKVVEAAAAIAAGEPSQLLIAYAIDTTSEHVLEHHPFAMQSQEDIDQAIAEKRQHHQTLLDRFEQQFRQQFSGELAHYLTLETKLIEGPAKKVLSQYVTDSEAELIVIGTAARSALKKWIYGSTTESVLKGVTCSVMAIKPSAFDEHN